MSRPERFTYSRGIQVVVGTQIASIVRNPAMGIHAQCEPTEAQQDAGWLTVKADTMADLNWVISIITAIHPLGA